MKKLTEICNIQYGYAFDSGCFTEKCSYPPLIRIRDVKRGFSETYYSGEYSKEYVVHAGDLLIGMDGEFNIARWKSVDGLLNQRVCKLTAKEGTDEEYLRFALVKALKIIENKTAFATVKHLSAKELNKLELDLPCIEKQSLRAKILTKLERIIWHRENELRELDNLIRARFVEVFGNENNSKHWKIVNVEEVANVQVGVVIKPTQYYTDAENGVKTFRSLNIGAGFIKDSEWVYFTKEGHQKNSKSILKENDLLIVRSGAPGTACVVTKEYVGCNAIDIIIARPDFKKVNPYYLCTYTNMPHGKKQIEEGTGGAAQQHFNVGKYNKLKLMLPPKELQDNFIEFVNQVDKSKVKVQKALDETQKLFDSLMQQYFG